MQVANEKDTRVKLLGNDSSLLRVTRLTKHDMWPTVLLHASVLRTSSSISIQRKRAWTWNGGRLPVALAHVHHKGQQTGVTERSGGGTLPTEQKKDWRPKCAVMREKYFRSDTLTVTVFLCPMSFFLSPQRELSRVRLWRRRRRRRR